jgi:hypothetical protein
MKQNHKICYLSILRGLAYGIYGQDIFIILKLFKISLEKPQMLSALTRLCLVSVENGFGFSRRKVKKYLHLRLKSYPLLTILS